MTRVTATEAARQLSDLLNRTFYRGESFELERNGQVVARLVPVRRPARLSDLAKLASLRTGDAGFADELERIQADQNTLEVADPWER